MAVNDHLRRVMQDNCLNQDSIATRNTANLPQSTSSSAEMTDTALLKSETSLCKQELSKLKLFLQDKDLWKNTTSDKNRTQNHPNRSILSLPSSESTQDNRLNAVKLIEFEIQSLRRKTDDLRKSNQQLTAEVC